MAPCYDCEGGYQSGRMLMISGGRGVIGLYAVEGVEGVVWCYAILWRLCGVLCLCVCGSGALG